MSGQSRDCKSTYTIETSQPQKDRVSLDPWHHDIHDFGADWLLQTRIMQSISWRSIYIRHREPGKDSCRYSGQGLVVASIPETDIFQLTVLFQQPSESSDECLFGPSMQLRNRNSRPNTCSTKQKAKWSSPACGTDKFTTQSLFVAQLKHLMQHI